MKSLRLRQHEDRRLRAGHLWVYSNEVDVTRTPLGAFEPGEQVRIEDQRGSVLGTGYVNPRSLICARLVSRDPGVELGRPLLRSRLADALATRERIYPDGPFYRLAHAESDGVPGLIVDRFGDVLVVQITTAGMERLRSEVLEVLVELVRPRGILLRNDTGSRDLEGLPTYVEPGYGTVPDRVEIRENGVRFVVPLSSGQKTGWFFDHRENRARLGQYVGGRRVLDVFSYAGGWGVQAATRGATQVVCLDSSAGALALARESASLNEVDTKVEILRGEAFAALTDLYGAGERFDVVVLDPPAFIKRRKDQKQGEKAYQRLNRLALALLRPGGVLVSASCSFHLSREALLGAILRASRSLTRELQILEEGHQSPDHPVHPAIPETAYLKAFFARLMCPS